jgi:tape measure domain-containing protein
MSEFAGILGKIKGAGKLTGETYLQLAEKGVVLNKVLSKQLGISLEEIPNLISKGEISYKRVLDSIGALTAKGGLFFEATIAQSKTLSGRFSTLKDNTLFLRAEIGELIANALGLNSRMESLTGRFSKATDAVKKFRTENAGLSKAIVFAIVGFTALAVAVTGLAAASFILAAAWSPITLGILAVVVVIGGLVALFNIAIRKWDEMSEGAKAFARSANPLIAIIRGVISGYNQLKGLGLFGGNEIEIKTAQATLDKNLNVNASSRTDVNVNVSAAKGAVAAVQTRREGSVPGVNIGVNNEKSLVG